MSALERLQQRVRERPWRAGLYAFMTLVVATALLAVLDQALRADTFPVRRVSFEGEFRNVDEKTLLAAVMESVRGNFLLVDLDAVRAKVKKVPWVYDASVRRQWPDGVHIRFVEQEIVARWNKDGWVNAQGDAVNLHGRPGPEGLPRLEGPEGTQARVLEHYRKLDELLVPAGLRLAQVTLTARHSWNLTLNNAVTLVIGRETPEPKVERLAQFYPATLAGVPGRAKRIDLRYANGFAVEWADRAMAPRSSEIVATQYNGG
ncbi:MAG: cell division protein FtsQ/DivIB [Gammaproteobacteria bacterium]|nr:cell division protein FtsQ/DivIB [Gammaproteobacteria bacterium]